MPRIEREHPQGYGYVVSRLKAMETRLIDDGVLQRVIDCDDIDGALKVLGETVYSTHLAELKSNYEFDSALENELLSAYGEVSRFVPDNSLVALCRMQYDYHNVKVLVKNVHQVKEGGERSYKLMTQLGSIPSDTLILAIEGEDYKLLPHNLDKAVPRALSAWEQTHSLQEVERVLDDSMFEVMLEKAESLQMPAVTAWIRARIDTENLRTMLRLKRVGADSAEGARFLHKGGFISTAKFAAVLAEPIEGWARYLASTELGKVFASIQETTDVSVLIIDMERALEEFSVQALSYVKYDAFAPANVLLYLWRKEMETRNLRIALVTVANGTDKEQARRLLRHAG